ncbi:hypothetical protein EDC96DRAFT_580649 [Choanephora cucurbitarum]|nr:hypothetical protein EDC96DRAFT_580649 [Choanephora cucurbitarum]
MRVLHSAASDITSSSERASEFSPTSITTQGLQLLILDNTIFRLQDIIEVSSDSTSDVNNQDNEHLSSSDESIPPLSSSSSSSDKSDISDFVRDADIQEVSSTIDMEQDAENIVEDQSNISPHPLANLSSIFPSSASSLTTIKPTSGVQVEVVDVTSTPAAPTLELSITHVSPLLLTTPPTSSTSDVDPTPPQPTSSISSADPEVLQGRTSDQEGDNVMATNRGSLSNHISLDFANTEEIPAFLRKWNVNKKHKFKLKPNSNSPAKAAASVRSGLIF